MLLLTQSASAAAPETFTAPGSSRKVILVQDHQAHEVNQLRSAGVVLSMVEKEHLQTIYTAGGTGDLSLLERAQAVDADSRRVIAGEWIAEQSLLTAEFIQLIYPVALDVRGVDVPVLYERAIEILRSLTKRSARFDSFLDLLNEAGPHPETAPTIERMRRFFDLTMTDEDLALFAEEPARLSLETVSPSVEARQARSFGFALKRLADLKKILNTRDVFMTESLLQQMDLRGEKKALWLVSGRSMEAITSYLSDRNVSYEIIRPAFDHLESSERYQGRLLDETLPGDKDGSWRSGWSLRLAQQEPLELRALRERAIIDLLNDRKPAIWRLGERFGLDAEGNLEFLFSSLGPSSASVLKRHDVSPGFTWADAILPKAHASALPAQGSFMKLWSQKLLENIDRDYDREKYEAFRVLSAKMETSKTGGRAAGTLSVIEGYIRSYEEALKAAEEAKLRKKQEFLGSPILTYWIQRFRDWTEQWTMNYSVDPRDLAATVEFVRSNRTAGGMPLSYETPKDYWAGVRSPMDAVDSVMERLIVAYSVSIYDAALWQIALSAAGSGSDGEAVDAYTQRLASGSSGDLMDIRAYGDTFHYGESRATLSREHGYFFRIIAEQYLQQDPLDGTVAIPDFPNFALLHHEDWKPITGEQAWAAIIGPLQRAYLKNGGHVPPHSAEMKLAKSIFPALEAMFASIGAFYHVPDGTHGKSPYDISNENNASMYAALGILDEALAGSDPALSKKIQTFRSGLRDYFRDHGFDRENGIFYQGGFFFDGTFLPAKIFAADCQTWGINALTPAWIDETFGEGTAYRIWQKTRELSGYFDEKGTLRGIGFSEGHDIHSVEWTCGAILSTRLLEAHYRQSHPEWSRLLRRDSVSMRQGIETFKTKADAGGTAYLYSNKRYFVPWGWWANPIPSLASSAWVVLIDSRFDPFVLGGGESYRGVIKKT